MINLAIFVVVCAVLVICQGRPDGAPVSACSSLTPVHRNFQAQNDPSQYVVTAQLLNNKVRVKLTSKVREEFQGFVLQARSRGNRQKIVHGTFTEKSGETKAVDCSNGRKNTLTHASPSRKNDVITDWTPANGVNEDVVFKATFLKNYEEFWTDIDSNAVSVQGPPGGGEEQEEPLSSNAMYRDCRVSQGCFGYPADCVENSNCEVMLSYGKNSNDNGIAFKMSGYLKPDQYMAFGISSDKKMGEDSVIECFLKNSRVTARQSWNDGRSNSPVNELLQEVYKSGYTNGLSTCSWTTPYITETNSRQFNLAQTNYYILLAKGALKEVNRLDYHHHEKLASGNLVNFSAFEAVESEGIHDAVKVHGTFMVTAWVGLVSLGILLARHFKSSWENRTIAGLKVWFVFHRGFMLLALCFVVVAFITIFVHKDGWNYETSNPHATLGCIATALGLFQPIMAAFRPGPDDSKRPIFNWLHFAVGNSAHIIAVITIFFARKLSSSGLDDYFYGVMSIFVVVHLVFHALFQIHSWNAGRKKSNEVKMLDMNSGRGGNGVQNSMPEKSIADNVFRVLLLGIYTIFLVAILVTLYALIGKA